MGLEYILKLSKNKEITEVKIYGSSHIPRIGEGLRIEFEEDVIESYIVKEVSHKIVIDKRTKIINGHYQGLVGSLPWVFAEFKKKV